MTDDAMRGFSHEALFLDCCGGAYTQLGALAAIHKLNSLGLMV